MATYADALDDPAQVDKLDALRKTYPAAAESAVKSCGNGYAEVMASSGGLSLFRRDGSRWFSFAVVLLSWVLLVLP